MRAERRTSRPVQLHEPVSNLPALVSSFVGRVRELAALRRILARTRLLTLTGMGGVGKTRLALRLAERVGSGFPDGVCFVDLAPLREPAQVPQSIAATLQLGVAPGQTAEQVLEAALRRRSLLLLLDNCEHLAESCAALVHALLTACPALCVLATSREPLQADGEVAWRVPPLSIPASPELALAGPGFPRLDQSSDAVALFVERARQGSSGFEITEENSAVIMELCRRLDGIPLAIELAAARVRVLSVAQILARLDDRFGLLVGGSRTVEPRHRTLRALLDWSYELLPDSERATLRSVAVFVGGFTLEAAEWVCAPGEGMSLSALELLTSLVDKSLVVAEERDGAVRYSLLETVRAYALDCLGDAGRDAAARDRHLTWWVRVSEQAELGLWGPEHLEWQRRMTVEIDNLRAALSWSLQKPNGMLDASAAGESAARTRLEAGLAMAASLMRLWDCDDYLREGCGWLRQLMSIAGSDVREVLRLKALNAAGYLTFMSGELEEGRTKLEQALAAAEALHDDTGSAWALTGLAATRNMQGEADAAEAFANRALPIWERLGWDTGLSMAQYILGEIARQRGDHDRAVQLLESSLAVLRREGSHWGSTYPLESLGRIAVLRGDYARATALLKESLALRYEQVNPRGAALCLEGLAWLAGRQDQPVRVARLFGAAQAVYDRYGLEGTPRWPIWQVDYQQANEVARGSLGEPIYDEAWAEGHAMSLSQAVDYALGDRLPTTMGARPWPGSSVLTRREREVAGLVARGLTNRKIAEELVITAGTAGLHVSNILHKLGFSARAQIAAWAASEGHRSESDTAKI